MSPDRQVLHRRRITSEASEAPLRLTRVGALRRFVWRLDTRCGLVIMFAAGLGIRLVLAPKYGFYGDLNLFKQWAQGLRSVGIRHFYKGFIGDTTFVYPPGYLYVLALLGRLSRSPGWLLLKSPAILGDLALAWIAGVFAVRLAPAALRERIPVRALVVAAVLFNPAVIALSSVWGQVDSVPAAFVLGSLLLLFTRWPTVRREIASIVLFALAFSMKPQSSFLFPVLGYALFRRHLYRQPLAGIGRGLVRIAAVGVPGAALWALSGIPFGLSPTGLEAFYSKASNGYKITSVWAFNLWGAIGFNKADVKVPYNVLQLVAGVPAFYAGGLLFGAGTLYVLWRAHRSLNRGHDEARVMLAAAAMLTLLAFTVLTRMHERYLFPAFACLAPLVIWRGFRRIYAVLSVVFVLNLWYPFALYNRSWGFVTTFKYEPAFHWLLGNIDTTNAWQKKMWSVFMVAACIVLIARGFRWIERVDDTRAPDEPALIPSVAL